MFWEPARPPESVGGTGDKAEVLQVLIETFGRDPDHPRAPVELHAGHLFALREFASRSGPASLYGEIVKLIEQNGKIRVWTKG